MNDSTKKSETKTEAKTAMDPSIEHEGASREVVTGIIQGDRVCIACGFNLCGQRIVREPRYNLLIARCPECGQAAALQEYPLLGRWANRWAATLAGLWLLLFFALSIGSGMAIFGLAVGTTEINADFVEGPIVNAHMQWQEVNNRDTSQTNRWSVIDPDWWDTVDQSALFEQAGGVRMIIWRASQTTWLGLLFAMIPIGCLGSVALLGVARSRLTLATIFPVIIASLASFLLVRAKLIDSGWGSSRADDLAWMMIWQWTFPMTIALGGVFLIVGMLIGRPLARFMAKTALPNRFVQALAILWTSEGREPPRPRR